MEKLSMKFWLAVTSFISLKKELYSLFFNQNNDEDDDVYIIHPRLGSWEWMIYKLFLFSQSIGYSNLHQHSAIDVHRPSKCERIYFCLNSSQWIHIDNWIIIIKRKRNEFSKLSSHKYCKTSIYGEFGTHAAFWNVFMNDILLSSDLIYFFWPEENFIFLPPPPTRPRLFLHYRITFYPR
ncbi:hypothetical protein DERF_005807 [Dermatophagoides farinae]|uniref:Uncharacterized protein n=1 Tax=Dermatophagoides farinae TaxID=6954 RepID=A0A922I6C6_DERFA|nr:hypothetical protein DERF_005807 [Dermatophagoides farinae]